jgi:hypothetical protein
VPPKAAGPAGYHSRSKIPTVLSADLVQGRCNLTQTGDADGVHEFAKNVPTSGSNRLQAADGLFSFAFVLRMKRIQSVDLVVFLCFS